MSENLNETVTVLVQDASVITVPIDDTLSNSGEAADAKAVGDALALKADASQVTGISVNGETADEQGHIVIDGADIKVDATAATPQTIKAALEALDGKTAEDIVYQEPEEGETPQTIKAHVDGIVARFDGMIGQIGTVVAGTNAESLSVPSGGWHTMSSIELDAGVWVVTGGLQFPSFSEVAACDIVIGSTEHAVSRGVGSTQKAFSVATVLDLEELSTVELRATQSNASAQTLARLFFRAVRLA